MINFHVHACLFSSSLSCKWAGWEERSLCASVSASEHVGSVVEWVNPPVSRPLHRVQQHGPASICSKVVATKKGNATNLHTYLHTTTLTESIVSYITKASQTPIYIICFIWSSPSDVCPWRGVFRYHRKFKWRSGTIGNLIIVKNTHDKWNVLYLKGCTCISMIYHCISG